MARNASWIAFVFLFSIVSLNLPPRIQCEDDDDYDSGNTAALPIVTDYVYSGLTNMTTAITTDIKAKLGFCIKDVDKEWNEAFNFTGKLDFLTACIKQGKDVTRRLCTRAEIRLYFGGILNPLSSSYVRPNRNCNLTSWVSGCEPGWGCLAAKNVDLTSSKDIPARTEECQPCCEGFFCPQGLTCMIPCPLGSYCPLAKLNTNTGICDPYRYQLPAGETNHTCGSAHVWTGVSNNSDIFCSAGSYCPTATQKIPCSSGHYCRMGSTVEMRCSHFSTCKENTENQNMRAYAALLIAAIEMENAV